MTPPIPPAKKDFKADPAAVIFTKHVQKNQKGFRMIFN
jgi:hypothetical protein